MNPLLNARAATLCVAGLVFLVWFHGMRYTSWVGNSTLHSMLESVSTMLALIVGILALVRNYTAKDVNLFFIGLGFLGAGLLDGHHLFVTSEYSNFPSSGVPFASDWVWVNSRLFLALMFAAGAVAWLYQRRPDRRHRITEPFVFAVAFVLMALSVTLSVLYPVREALFGLDWRFVEATAIAAAFCVALLLYVYKGAWRYDDFEFWLVVSVIAGLVSQTNFLSADGRLFSGMYFVAHGLKLFSYGFVLVGLILSMYHLFKRAAANEAKTAFVATISHEIRTPLNAIGGTLGLLEKAQLTQQEQELLSVAKESNDVLLGIVNNVLDFSKIEAGKLEVLLEECHPAEILDNVARLLSTRGFRNRTHLVSEIDPDTPESVITDERLVRQVLLNLVSNAIKYSPDGEVTIKVHVTGTGALCFEVTDTGVGIPKSEHTKVFDEFSRVPSRDSVATSGTGLGLPISKRLVNLLGGNIGFTSKSGSGSTFWFTVPCVPVQPVVLQPGAAGEFTGLKALIVGTRKGLWTNLERQLMLNGVEVRFEDVRGLADQGLAALERNGRFDVLFTAWSFFGGGNRVAQGREWLYDNHRELADRLVLLYSAPSMLRVDAREVEHAAYVLTMPILNGELWRCLQEVTGRQIAHPERRSSTHEPAMDGDVFRGVRVLLVEDSRANRAVESAILTRLGCRVEEAVDGVAAVEAVEHACYDIVLMDLEMPNMNGFEAAQRIRQLPGQASQVPIIAVTAHVLSGTNNRCRRAGMNAYVVKPIDREKLVAAITEFVPRKQTLSVISDDDVTIPVRQRRAS